MPGVVTANVLTRCEDEPITRLDRIQNFGFLLVLSQEWVVIRASANLAAHLGIDAGAAIGQPFEAIATAAAVDAIRDRMAALFAADSERLFGVVLVDGRPPFDLNLHLIDDHLVIEGEPAQPDSSIALISVVRLMIAQLAGARDLESFHQAAARRVRDITGFDRVLVYRFDMHGHGEVVAESIAPNVESLLGMHYPATDIPQQARALYMRNPFRIISDVGETPVPLLPESVGAIAPLDLSMAMTRAVSPVHIEYLANMGVGATLSISIIVAGDLWGLFACHHFAPRVPSLAMRTAAELIGNMYSLALEGRLARAAAALEQRAGLLADRLIGAVAGNEALLSDPIWLADMTHEIIDYDGIALVRAGDVLSRGAVPPDATILDMARYLNLVAPNRVFSTEQLAVTMAPLFDPTGAAAGLLAIPISRTPRDYLMLFRREQVESINWGGEIGDSDQKDRGHVLPRKSFAAFPEIVRGKARPFSDADLRLGEAVRSALVEVILRLSAVANKALSAEIGTRRLMATAIAHELNQPLAAIASYLGGIARLAERGVGDPNTMAMITDALQRAAGQAAHAGNMLKILRSSITRDDTAFSKEDVCAVAEAAVDQARAESQDLGIDFRFDCRAGGQSALMNQTQIRQVLANLLQNATEAVTGTERREIAVTISSDDTRRMLIVAVADTGPGVSPEAAEMLFTPFISTKPNGMGIGLSISREIIEQHFGKLTMQPNPGGGSIFVFTLPIVAPPAA